MIAKYLYELLKLSVLSQAIQSLHISIRISVNTILQILPILLWGIILAVIKVRPIGIHLIHDVFVCVHYSATIIQHIWDNFSVPASPIHTYSNANIIILTIIYFHPSDSLYFGDPSYYSLTI